MFAGGQGWPSLRSAPGSKSRLRALVFFAPNGMVCTASSCGGPIMIGTARVFFVGSIAFGLLGMLLGLAMAIRQDHSAMPAHAHILVIGWLSFALFGLFYHLFPTAAASVAARIHCWLAATAAPVLFIASIWSLRETPQSSLWPRSPPLPMPCPFWHSPGQHGRCSCKTAGRASEQQ